MLFRSHSYNIRCLYHALGLQCPKGFHADRPRPGGAGLELASTIVREKLTGEWSVESGPGGTRISFDFLEQ